MNTNIGFLNYSLNNIITEDQPILDQARVKFLYYGLCLGGLASLILLLNLFIGHQHALMMATGALFLCVGGLFKYLTYRPRYKIIAHIILSVATLINLINVFAILQNVNIVTIQVTVLVIIFSFFMLGQISGIFYSLLNLIPVLIFLELKYNDDYFAGFDPVKIDDSTIIVAAFFNFALIVGMIAHFYKVFLKIIRQVTEIVEEQDGLNIEFAKAMEKAEKSSLAKSEFLSTMSHEIRTPLNAVIGMGNLLMMGNPRPDQRENLEILKFSATNLLSIVNDVLDFNKIEAGKVQFENIRFNLLEMMRNICGGQMLKAKERGLTFQLNMDESLRDKVIFGDPTRITQIIFNLISNAIKFTHAGNIWVNVTCLEDRHDTVTVNFSVKDTGIGIDKENMESIFEPFAQESLSTTRQYGGTGLGLAIVKRLMELMDIKMKVFSKIGVGSEFSFNMKFPVSTETIEEKVKKLPSLLDGPEGLANLRVLIAEDNLVNVMLMKKLFSKWSIVPTIAENGERAVELVQYGNFDIILMDLQMPVMSGFDATIEIRKMKDPKKAHVPIIALTASALFDIRERVFNSGMNDYLSKPFKPDELMEKMQVLLEPIN